MVQLKFPRLVFFLSFTYVAKFLVLTKLVLKNDEYALSYAMCFLLDIPKYSHPSQDTHLLLHFVMVGITSR